MMISTLRLKNHRVIDFMRPNTNTTVRIDKNVSVHFRINLKISQNIQWHKHK